MPSHPAERPASRAAAGPYKLDKSSIRWTKRGVTDPFANLKPRLDYESPNVAEVRPNLQLVVRADCNSPSGRCEVNTYSFKSATVDMLKEPLAVKWVD